MAGATCWRRGPPTAFGKASVAFDRPLCAAAQDRAYRPLLISAGKRPPPPRRQPGESPGGDSKREVPDWKVRSRHGKSYESKGRRRGRPAWQRSPNDTPLRDGNRDRVIGLLTDRAVRTLIYYFSETNMHLFYWLSIFYKEHQIPRDGHWDDVSGETFLRTLLNMPMETASAPQARDPIYSRSRGCGVDPRNLAQRIMDIRSQIAKEMTQDLKDVSQENTGLLRETLTISFSLDNIVAHPIDPTS